MKGFSRQVIKYLVRCINVWYIISECLYVIGAETWEEFTEKVMNLGHFCLNRVAQLSVGIIQMTLPWAVLGDYTFTFWVSKQGYG